MEEKEIITIIDENGTTKEVEVIHYFTLDSNGLDYIVYTDNVADESGNVLVYTSQVIEHGERVELAGIESDEVLQQITAILTKLIES
ncbi:MAG: DUF1292 domain-containing protein [bacterium]